MSGMTEMKGQPNSNYVTFDGMVWPALGPRRREVEYELRYGAHPNFMAASIVAAYIALLRSSGRYREHVVRGIRALSGHTVPTKAEEGRE